MQPYQQLFSREYCLPTCYRTGNEGIQPFLLVKFNSYHLYLLLRKTQANNYFFTETM